jgi:tetratricopeptide (TPR) repeat protein
LLPPSGGINLFVGNNPEFHHTVTARPGWQWLKIRSLPQRNGWGADMWSGQGYYFTTVQRFAQEQPLAFARGLGEKTLHLLSSREIPRSVDVYAFRPWSKILTALVWKWGGFGFPFGLILPLAVVGLLVGWRQVPMPVVLFLVTYAAAIVLVFVAARYRVVLLPVLAILAGRGSVALYQTWQARQLKPLALMAGGVGVTLLVTSLPGPFAQERHDFTAEIYHGVGFNHYQAQRWDQAKENFETALALNPNLMEAHNYLGVILAREERFTAAADHFAAAFALDASYQEAKHNLDLARRLAAEAAAPPPETGSPPP